jgi:hemoglobin/transferrin/lactoferrin receptor protein
MDLRPVLGKLATSDQTTRTPVHPMQALAQSAGIGRPRALAGLLILLAPLTLRAQHATAGPDGDDHPVDEIVVVAHKDQRSVREIAANVTVMSREDINASLSTSMADVFRYTPGIDYESAGARFGDEGINIRGIGGNRVALLVDGVPLGDQFDVGSFSNATRDFINAGLVERIEVLHGPASALYGSSAIGGVVAVRTPDPMDLIGSGNTGGDLLATWHGADNGLGGTGMFALGDASTAFLLGGSLSEGQETESAAVDQALDYRDYRRRSGLLKLVADGLGGNTWRIGFMHQDAEVHSDLNSMLGTGRFVSTTALEGDDRYRMDMLNVAYEFGGPEFRIDSGIVRGFYERTDVRQDTLDERGNASRPVAIDRYFQFDQDISGIELNLQKVLTRLKVEHRLGFGVEYRQRRTEEYRDGVEHGLIDGAVASTILGEDFPLRDFPISDSSEWGAYLEDVMTIGDWSIVMALRGDRYNLDPLNDPMYAEDYPFAEPVSLSESDLSPKIGFIYRAYPSTELYVQYAHGFRAPPYEDANIGLEIPLFNYRAIPNPELESESSDGIDLGIRWQGEYASFRAGVFRTQYEDFIESRVRLGTDPVSGRILFQSQNISETLIEGYEAGWDVRFGGGLQNFSTDGSLYKATGENRDNGQPLNSVGPGQAVIGAGWGAPDGKFHLRLQALLTESWSERDETGGELFKPPGSGVLDFYYTQRLGERMTLRAGLMNVTDRIYWLWSDARGLSPDDPVVPYLAQPGRNFSLSANMHW